MGKQKDNFNKKYFFRSCNHRVHIFLEMKQGQCIRPHSWSVHCNFTGDGKCNESREGVGVHPPPSPARANFTLMTECTPESRGCYSVYSVAVIIRCSAVPFAGRQDLKDRLAHG